MKKGLLIILLLVLVLFCLIAIGVGGFFGYRYWQHKKAAEVSSFAAQPSEPPAAEQPSEPGTPPAAEPESAQPSEMPPAESTSPEGAPSSTEAQPPAESAPAPAPEQPTRSRPRPRPAPAAPAPQETAVPTTPAAASPGSAEEPSSPAQESAPATQAAPTAAVKEKIPKGTLGLIFEATIDKGNVAIRVDNDLVAKQDFTASSSERFRLTKDLLLEPGQHRVWVKVKLPDGKKYEKDWNAMVVVHGITVWKAEMTRFPKELNVKPIPVKN
ncbi:MAG: hypothetical protein WBS54_15105 [Acidobacteriota bacterium]